MTSTSSASVVTDAGKDRSRPLVWALTGARVGDNQQVVQFSQALGFDVREIELAYRGLRVLPNWLLGATQVVVKRVARAELQPPWPDLVVGAGQRSVSVARWIRRKSGGRTRLVFLGRPRAPLNWFDLVITTPQYGLPREGNVMMVPLPYVTKASPGVDAGYWLVRWAALARPVTAVLVGGSTPPYKIDRTSMRRLVEESRRVADGGTVLYVTSPRTSTVEADWLEQLTGDGDELIRWEKDKPNPYSALLSYADRFVVTEDSVSMIAEACATGKPVTVASLKRSWSVSWRADSGLARSLARRGILSPPRNVRRLISLLVEASAISMRDHDVELASADAVLDSWPEVVIRVRRMVLNA